jgi:rsbT antagonist protein RsbS
MDTSIIRIGDVLIVTLQEALHDTKAVQLQDDISEALSRTGASGLLIDVTVLDLVDSFMGRLLNGIAAIARLMGARTIISGIQPQVAITLVELGLRLQGVETVLDVEQGLARFSGSRDGRFHGRA